MNEFVIRNMRGRYLQLHVHHKREKAVWAGELKEATTFNTMSMRSKLRQLRSEGHNVTYESIERC